MSFIKEIEKALHASKGESLSSSLAVVKSVTTKKVKVEIDGAEIEAFYNTLGKPKSGSKCLVNFPEGSPDRATASGFSEMAEVDTTIADVIIKINSDGITIELNGPSQKIAITGDLEIDGKLNVSGLIESDEDVKVGLISLQNHTHTSSTPGSPTSPPV